MRSKIAMIVLLAALVAVMVAPPSVGFSGFHDDSYEECLGDDDPFCGGGGGPESTCWQCYWTLGASNPVQCKKNIGGRQVCTIVHHANTILCDESGETCV